MQWDFKWNCAIKVWHRAKYIVHIMAAVRCDRIFNAIGPCKGHTACLFYNHTKPGKLKEKSAELVQNTNKGFLLGLSASQ